MPPTKPRYNIAPTATVTVVTATATGGRRFIPARWGLIPAWAGDRRTGTPLINARAETLGETPVFRRLLARRRCLVPADGYYEWTTTTPGRRQPIWAALATGEVFAFAGLWDWWAAPSGEAARTCTIVTCAPNAVMARYHHRMPVILQGPPAEAHWLDPAVTELGALRSVLVPYPADAMVVYPVSTAVNNVRNEGPQLILPLE